MLNVLFCCDCVSLALKSPYGEWSIKYALHCFTKTIAHELELPYMHYILESTFARIFLFLELNLQLETHIYINLHQFAHCLCYFCLRLKKDRLIGLVWERRTPTHGLLTKTTLPPSIILTSHCSGGSEKGRESLRRGRGITECLLSTISLHVLIPQLSNQLAARLRQNNINVLAEVRLQANDPARAIRTIKVKSFIK